MKIFVMGLGATDLPAMVDHIASAGLDAEIVSVDSVDDIPVPEMKKDDMVLNLGPENDFEAKAEELEFTLRANTFTYEEPTDKQLKKIRKAERRAENRSKKDRRNHR